MKVSTARSIGRDWVLQNATVAGEMTGAFFHGSINWIDDNEELPLSSDLDIILVTGQPIPSIPKFTYRGVIMDVSNMVQHDIAGSAQVLDKYYLAGNFRSNNIIYDANNRLRAIQQEVEKVYKQQHQVKHRCRLAMDHAVNMLTGISKASSLPDRFTAWLFARGILTHVLLNAALRNPTVRRRYLDTKFLLNQFGYDELYEELLKLQGFNRFTKEQTIHHLRALSEVFDVAAKVIRTPYRFSGDITAFSKRITIGGSEELINAGHHREALFWICASFARCMHVINQDGETPAQIGACQLKFDELINDISVIPGKDFNTDNASFYELAPRVWETAMQIMGA